MEMDPNNNIFEPSLVNIQVSSFTRFESFDPSNSVSLISNGCSNGCGDRIPWLALSVVYTPNNTHLLRITSHPP